MATILVVRRTDALPFYMAVDHDPLTPGSPPGINDSRPVESEADAIGARGVGAGRGIR